MRRLFGLNTRSLAAGVLGGKAPFIASYLPTYGTELLTNGGFDADASWSKGTGWTIGSGVATHGGAVGGNLSQSCGLAKGNFYSIQMTTSGRTLSYYDIICGGSDVGIVPHFNNTTETEVILQAASTGADIYFRAISDFNGSLDNLSCRILTLASTLRSGQSASALATVKANLAGVAGIKIGVAANLNSISAPTYGVFGFIDPYGKAWLYQLSNGVWTGKITAGAITYATGALVEVRHTDATTYQLWYNGSQVGANQTISDAGINNNTLYAQFNTGNGTVFTSFSIVPNP